MDNHLHNPRPIVLCLPRALRNEAVVLAEAPINILVGTRTLRRGSPHASWWTRGAPYVSPTDRTFSEYVRIIANKKLTRWSEMYVYSSGGNKHRMREICDRPEKTW